MKIQNTTVFNGRNVYSHKPVIRIVLDLEELYDKTTKDIVGFTQNLTALFPTLEEHYCGLGYKGAFIERLNEGTYFGHVLEHIILELQYLTGYDVHYGKTRLKDEPGLYNVIFEFKNEAVAVECVKQAITVIENIIAGQQIDVDSTLDHLNKFKQKHELGPSTQAIFDEATKRGIPVTRLGSDSILQLGYGKYSRLVEASITDSTSCISVDIACNKELTKQILEDNDIPVPIGGIAYTAEEAVSIANDISLPVILKPLNGNQGKGVVLNLSSEDEIKEAIKMPLEFDKAVIVEKFLVGKDYRVLVIGDKVSAVSERIPPFITGDGKHNIQQLIEIENKNPLRGEDHEKPLTKIKLDNIALNYLKKNGLDQNSIPAKNVTISLRDNANLSTGGTARECTKDIHPHNAEIAVKAAKAIGLDIAGVDIKTEDISKPIRESHGAVLEVNAAPGLRMHLHPGQGDKINVASDILDLMYPQGTPHSVPVIAITGTNGKTTNARLIKHTLTLSGKTVGMTSTSGIYVGGECILKGDNTGPFSAKTVLRNKKVETAVLEVARGGILKKGLGYDLADVGLITNIGEDHIGLDGVKTLEDLAFVKSLVVEAVKPTGFSVLNADDAMVGYLLKRAKGSVILFSKDYANPLVAGHIKSGGKALYVRNNIIYICDTHKEMPLIDMRDIPITFKGTLNCNIENSLSAAACLYGLGIPLGSIKEGLVTFKPDVEMNPGRFNIFDLGKCRVMLDYGHNIGGYEEVGKFAQKLGASRLIGVIGVPGDRPDDSISRVGALCSQIFDKVYIKEDADLRGREPGQVANIMNSALISSGYDSENIKIILSEQDALQTAIFESQDNDLIILFYENFDAALRIINRIKEIRIEREYAQGNVIEMPMHNQPAFAIPIENVEAIAEI